MSASPHSSSGYLFFLAFFAFFAFFARDLRITRQVMLTREQDSLAKSAENAKERRKGPRETDEEWDGASPRGNVTAEEAP